VAALQSEIQYFSHILCVCCVHFGMYDVLNFADDY